MGALQRGLLQSLIRVRAVIQQDLHQTKRVQVVGRNAIRPAEDLAQSIHIHRGIKSRHARRIAQVRISAFV